MKTLFKMDMKNYADSDTRIRRPSARAVIRVADGRLALVYSRKHQYYKYPIHINIIFKQNHTLTAKYITSHITKSRHRMK